MWLHELNMSSIREQVLPRSATPAPLSVTMRTLCSIECDRPSAGEIRIRESVPPNTMIHVARDPSLRPWRDMDDGLETIILDTLTDILFAATPIMMPRLRVPDWKRLQAGPITLERKRTDCDTMLGTLTVMKPGEARTETMWLPNGISAHPATLIADALATYCI